MRLSPFIRDWIWSNLYSRSSHLLIYHSEDDTSFSYIPFADASLVTGVPF